MEDGGRAWFIFWGWVFTLMGLRLFLDSEEKARAASEWDGYAEPSAGGGDARAPRTLVGAYRLGGLIFFIFGAGLGAAAVFRPGAVASLFGPGPMSSGGRTAMGAVLLFTGGSWAILQALRARIARSARLSEAGEGLGPGPAGGARNISQACAWLLAGSVAAYGLVLLRGG